MNKATMTGEGARYPKRGEFRPEFELAGEGFSIDAPNWILAGAKSRGEYWDKFTGHAWAADQLIIRDYM